MEDKKLIIPVKRFRGETIVVSARLPVSLVQELDRIGVQTGRNRNEIMNLCLEYAVENLELQEEREGEPR